MIRLDWRFDWRKQRIEEGGGDEYDHIYMKTKQGNQKRVGPLDVDALRSSSLETLNPLRFQGGTVVLVSVAGLSKIGTSKRGKSDRNQ